MNPSQRDSYRTPPEVFAYYHDQYRFAADVAASDENHLLPVYITEQSDALSTGWGYIGAGSYVWCNPPYSKIGPWIDAAFDSSTQGVGTVMLVMADQSVGWFLRAINCGAEVEVITGGRLSFLDPHTGNPANGNNKGSMMLIWHPYCRISNDPRTRYVERDHILEVGKTLISADTTPADHIADAGKMIPGEPDSVECEDGTHESSIGQAPVKQQSNNPDPLDGPTEDSPAQTTQIPDKTLDDWHWEYLHGDSMNLPSGCWVRFVVVLTFLFGIRDSYSARDVATAIAVSDDQLRDEFTNMPQDRKDLIRRCIDSMTIFRPERVSDGEIQAGTMALKNEPDVYKLRAVVREEMVINAMREFRKKKAEAA